MDKIELADVDDLIDRLRRKNIGDWAQLLVKRELQVMTIDIQLLETKP